MPITDTPKVAQNDPLLSVEEVAELAGCSPHTLNARRSSGGGPAFSSQDGKIVYRKSEVVAWLSEADGLLDTAQAARIIGCSTRHLENLRCYGSGPPYVKLKGQRGRTAIFYRPEDLSAWSASR